MTDHTLPDRLRALADWLEYPNECGDDWEHPGDLDDCDWYVLISE